MENKQTKGLKRNTIDKYYTKNNIVELCLTSIQKYLNIGEQDMYRTKRWKWSFYFWYKKII